MKKLLLILLAVILSLQFIGCDFGETTFDENVTIDCIPGYYWDRSDNSCQLNTDGVIFGEDIYTVYKIQYSSDEYTVYRAYVFLGYDNDIIVDIGDYNGYHYYFSSDTHYNYYLVEKDGIYKQLIDAIEAEWFSLEDLVNQFDIAQLQSEELTG